MYQQVVGTAMGTSFSVVYAVICMIWLETPIVIERVRSCLQLSKLLIDNLFIIWIGSVVPSQLCDFRKALARQDRLKLTRASHGAHCYESVWT